MFFLFFILIRRGGEKMKEQLMKNVQTRISQYLHTPGDDRALTRKLDCYSKRKADIVKVEAKANVRNKYEEQACICLDYDIHLRFLVRQYELMYVEEKIEHWKAAFLQGKLVADEEQKIDRSSILPDSHFENRALEEEERHYYTYNRMKAVQYAERWWNDHNPAYKSFHVDCTNYISQCLHAGGAPMRGYPNRSKGWWMQHSNWSYSWSVAHALRSYLPSSKSGLRAVEVSAAEQLQLGDVICYDFEGDGRYDHNTIVTGKDADGQPLVNAHTNNSRMRFWAYEDSAAYTDNIQYKFFTIKDDS